MGWPQGVPGGRSSEHHAIGAAGEPVHPSPCENQPPAGAGNSASWLLGKRHHRCLLVRRQLSRRAAWTGPIAPFVTPELVPKFRGPLRSARRGKGSSRCRWEPIRKKVPAPLTPEQFEMAPEPAPLGPSSMVRASGFSRSGPQRSSRGSRAPAGHDHQRRKQQDSSAQPPATANSGFRTAMGGLIGSAC